MLTLDGIFDTIVHTIVIFFIERKNEMINTVLVRLNNIWWLRKWSLCIKSWSFWEQGKDLPHWYHILNCNTYIVHNLCIFEFSSGIGHIFWESFFFLESMDFVWSRCDSSVTSQTNHSFNLWSILLQQDTFHVDIGWNFWYDSFFTGQFFRTGHVRLDRNVKNWTIREFIQNKRL